MEGNPNGVNQYTDPDPRQSLFLAYYLDPKSETFSNAYKSGLKAGYSDDYSKVILNKDLDWLSESVNDSKLISKAEKNLDLFLEGEDEKIRADITKFVLSRLKKDKYSERSELTGKEGKELKIVLSPEIADKNDINPITSSNS